MQFPSQGFHHLFSVLHHVLHHCVVVIVHGHFDEVDKDDVWREGAGAHDVENAVPVGMS